MCVGQRAMYELGRGKWVFVDWTGIDPGYGVAGDGSGVAGVYLPRGVELEVGAPFVERDRVIGLDCPWESGETAYATHEREAVAFVPSVGLHCNAPSLFSSLMG